MKKMVLLIPFYTVLAACGPTNNEVDIAQAQSIIEAARAAQDAARAAQIASQGLSDVGRGQTLILVLLTIILLLLVALAAYILIRRQVWKHSQTQQRGSGPWMSGPNARWKRVEGEDPYQQLLLQQQRLLTQLLQQSQADTEEDNHPQLPDSWWG